VAVVDGYEHRETARYRRSGAEMVGVVFYLGSQSRQGTASIEPPKGALTSGKVAPIVRRKSARWQIDMQEKTGDTRRLWHAGAAVLLTLLLAVLLAARPAEAEPRIKAGGCKVYTTNHVDPIAFAGHLHHQFGNTSTTNSSTGRSLVSSGRSSCAVDWFTSAAWFPVERNEPVRKIAVYYRTPGDQRQVRNIPTGLQLLGTDEKYNCGTAGTFQETPPYGRQGSWTTRVVFPDCWNQRSLEETTTLYSKNGRCPSSHPYKLPQISYLIQHTTTGVTYPLRVSAGHDAWGPYTAMHADYFAANQ
jgi:hypothetical protein